MNKYLRNYIFVNSQLALITYAMTYYSNIYINNLAVNSINMLMIFTLRNVLITNIIDNSIKNKEYISNDSDRNNEISYSMIKYLIQTSFLEAFNYILCTYLFDITFFTNNFIILFVNFICFIPISFIFEIIFDLLHYSVHYIFHKTKLYKYHKEHHKITHPTSLSSFYQHPIDYTLSNSLPLIILVYIFNYCKLLNMYIFMLILTYKVHIEIAGHCGKLTRTSSFPQCIWLPKLFNIELYTMDHDNHHTKNNCNYSKRFTLWDKFFGTYQKKLF